MRRHKDPGRRQPKPSRRKTPKQKTPQARKTTQAEDNASPEDPRNPDSRHNRHKHGGTAPDMGHCTRYVALHPLCGGAPEQKRCIAYGSGVVPQHTRINAELAHRTTHRRTPPCAAGPYWWQDAHAAHATTCTPAHSYTSRTLTCEEPVYVRYSRLAHALAGSRANNTPCPRQFCPQRRPPRPRHPIVGVCRWGGLHFGRHTTPNRDLTTPNRDLTAPNRDLTTPDRDLTASKRGELHQ